MEKKKRTREAVIFREKRSDQSVFLKGEAVIFRERRRAGCCFQRDQSTFKRDWRLLFGEMKSVL